MGRDTYYYEKRENDRRDEEFAAKELKFLNEINTLKASTTSIDEKINLIFKSNESKKYKWNETTVSAPVFADYIFLIFRSSAGQIAGHVRIKDTEDIYPFSTQVNNRIPVTVHNLWLPEKNQYQTNPVLEYKITSTSNEKNSLNIFTSGFNMSSGF